MITTQSGRAPSKNPARSGAPKKTKDAGIPEFLLRKKDNSLLHPPKKSPPGKTMTGGLVSRQAEEREPTVLERAMLDERFDLVPPKVWKALPMDIEWIALQMIFHEYATRGERREERRAQKKAERAADPKPRKKRGGAKAGLVKLRGVLREMKREGTVIKMDVAEQALLSLGPKPSYGWRFSGKDVEVVKRSLINQIGILQQKGVLRGGMKTVSGKGGSKPKAAPPATGTIKLLVKANPRKIGSAAYGRMEKLLSHAGKSVEIFVAAGGNPETLANAIAKGWVSVEVK